MPRVSIPEVLPTSPLTLWCPYCGANPGKNCQTVKGGSALLHFLRIAAAALVDTKGVEIRANAKRDAGKIKRKKKRATP